MITPNQYYQRHGSQGIYRLLQLDLLCESCVDRGFRGSAQSIYLRIISHRLYNNLDQTVFAQRDLMLHSRETGWGKL